MVPRFCSGTGFHRPISIITKWEPIAPVSMCRLILIRSGRMPTPLSGEKCPGMAHTSLIRKKKLVGTTGKREVDPGLAIARLQLENPVPGRVFNSVQSMSKAFMVFAFCPITGAAESTGETNTLKDQSNPGFSKSCFQHVNYWLMYVPGRR